MIKTMPNHPKVTRYVEYFLRSTSLATFSIELEVLHCVYAGLDSEDVHVHIIVSHNTFQILQPSKDWTFIFLSLNFRDRRKYLVT